MDILRCRNHPTAPTIEDAHAGDVICAHCGLVVGERIVDVGSEWRTFGNSDKKKDMSDPSRVGIASKRIEGDDLSTGTTDIGVELSWTRATKRSGNAMREAISRVRRYLDRVCTRLNVQQSTKEGAIELFKKYYESGNDHVQGHEPLAAGCLYIQCQVENFPRSPKEIAAATGLSQRKVARCANKVKDKMNDLHTSTTDISSYMGRFCSKVQMNSERQTCKYVADKVEELGLHHGPKPTTVAATVIYLVSLVSDSPATIAEIARWTGVAAGTIKNYYRELYPVRHFLFPKEFKFAHSLDNVPCYGSPTTPEGKTAEQRALERGMVPVGGEPLPAGKATTVKVEVKQELLL